MYNRIAGILPKKFVLAFKKQLAYVGINVEEKRFVGFLITFGLALSFGISLNLYFFLAVPAFLGFIGAIIAMVGGTYLWLSIVSESKGRFVERILPDALQLIASNIKSGLTTERALFVSARQEFGPLSDELKTASKKILTGTKMEDALAEMSEKISSTTFERTIWLINKGITSGGQIADLLVQLSDDLREQNALQDEIRANISVYVILILVAAALFAPMMFGISSFITQILSKRMEGTGNIPLGIGISTARNPQAIAQAMEAAKNTPQVKLTGDFITMFAVVALIVTAIFASLIMGVINTGKEKNGVKMILPIIILSIIIFFAVKIALAGAFPQLL